MPELSHIDPGSTALLVMDYQVDTLTRFMTAAQSADAIACVPDLIATARDAGMMVIRDGDRSSGRRSGLWVGRRPRLLRRPRCRGACDAARHRHREAGGRRHHGGARRRPAWQVFMNEHER
jgi:hypothetical protein